MNVAQLPGHIAVPAAKLPGHIDVARLCPQPGVQAMLGPSRLHFADGRIRHIEPLQALPDGALHRLALPAPSNAHDHGRGLRTLAFGAGDQTLETWLAELAFEPRVDPYLRAAVAFARMAEGGIAAANHCHNTQDGRALLHEAEAVARAARDTGVRIAFSVPFAGRNSVLYGDIQPLLAQLPEADHGRILAMRQPTRSLQENLALTEAIAQFEHAGFSVQYGPVGPQWVDDATLAAVARASADTGRRVHMHLFETRRQREWADANHPGGLLRHLDRIGLLSPRLTVAHAVWLRDDECALLAERGVTVSANASSNLRLRSGTPAWARYRASGLRIGLGLDGMSLDDDEDMLREMRLAWHQMAGACDDADGTLAELFDAACVQGRRSITGDDGGGCLRPGAPADVLVLDTQRITRDQLNPERPGLLELVLGRATRRDIAQLLVAGRSLVQDGRCVSVDLPALEQALLDQARAVSAVQPPESAAIVRLRQALRRHLGCGVCSR